MEKIEFLKNKREMCEHTLEYCEERSKLAKEELSVINELQNAISAKEETDSESGRELLFLCNGKSKECKKTNCYKGGGTCRHTSNVSYAENFQQFSNVFLEKHVKKASRRDKREKICYEFGNLGESMFKEIFHKKRLNVALRTGGGAPSPGYSIPCPKKEENKREEGVRNIMDEKEKIRHEKYVAQREAVNAFAYEIIDMCKEKGFTLRQLNMLTRELPNVINDYLIDKQLETLL